MSCLDENTIDLFLSRKLDPASRRDVEAHLARCGECRRVVSSLAIAATDDEPAPTSAFSFAPRVFEPEELVAERYRIVRFVGQGGMGEVYEAEDRQLKTRVALKAIRFDVATEPSAVERFRREVLFARKVTHPNVCRIFDIGLHRSRRLGADVPFLTMEFLVGKTLSELVREKSRLAEDAALPLVDQIALGLDAAHRAGIVHRDFKSQNVIVTGDGASARAVITDFGLARSEAPEGVATTSAHAFVGSPATMAPEQVRGQPVSRATDVYALGVVLYEMVTGTLPFPGSSPLEIATRRLVEDPPLPSRHVAGLSTRWEEAIMKCLARAEADRFDRTTDLVAALKHEPPPARRAARSTRRAWAIATVLVLLASVGLVVRFTRSVARAEAPSPSTSGPPSATTALASASASASAPQQSTSASASTTITTRVEKAATPHIAVRPTASSPLATTSAKTLPAVVPSASSTARARLITEYPGH